MTFHRIVGSVHPHQASYRARQKARGLCLVCPKPVAEGTRRCRKHLLMQREAARKARERKAS